MQNSNIENKNSEEYIDLRNESIPNSSFDINNDNSKTMFGEAANLTSTSKKNLVKRVAIVVTVIAVILAGIYFLGVNYFTSHFLPNTYISGFNSSFQSLDETNKKLNQVSHARKVTLVGKDATVSDVRAEDIGLNLVDPEESQKVLNSQNQYLWPMYMIHFYSNRSDSEHNINEDALVNKIKELPIVNGEQIVKTENAKANYNGNQFEVKEEVYGTEVNTEILKDSIKKALENGDSEISLDEENCYVMPTLTSENANLNSNINKLNSALNSVITYDFKSSQEVLDKSKFAGWLSTDNDGNITINDEEVNNYIQSLKDKYDTLGKEQSFKTSSGQQITMTNWYTGWEIDAEKEAAALKDNILNGQPVTKEPVYSSVGKDRAAGNAITGTYLEISIADQTMWYYQNNELIVSTPVVTGNVYEGYGTPTGLYEIQAKSTNVVLKGDNGDGSQYESPVTFWMPFNGGIGVHDASWRSSYGGSIYLGGGSHGCVNTPYSAARTIFNNISVGDPVVVY